MTENKTKEVRYLEILNAASDCFAQKGYLGTSVEDICKKANITKGGLYWHFASKKKILNALVDDLCGAQQEIWQTLAKIEISNDTLRLVGHQFIQHNLQNESKVRLFAILDVESLRDPEIKRALKISRNTIHEALISFSKRILIFFNATTVDETSFAHFLDLSVSGIVKKKIFGLVDIDVEKSWDAICDMIIKSFN